MDTKKISLVLCPIFAAVTILFTVMAIMNFTKGDEQTQLETKAAEYVMSGEVKIDALADTLKGVLSKDMKEQTEYPEGIMESMKQAYAVNNDLVGWLSIPGTEIDTAIVQGEDNKYYLTKDFYKRTTYETSGTNYGNLYLDYRCITDGLSKNMVIHGHTTGKSDGVPKQSFRSLYDFRSMEHFIKNPLIKYSTLYEEYTYKICAVFLSNALPKDDNGYFLNYIYPDMSDNNMVGYIEQVKQRMLYDTGVTLEPTDKIITLSTCIYDYGKSVDTRLVVVGRLLHEGETEAIDTSLVKDNPDYRRPQVWYNSKGKTNPYKNAERWQPSAE